MVRPGTDGSESAAAGPEARAGRTRRAGRPSGDRLLGLALFAFIPLTLYLMLAMPLGGGWSLLLAASIIAVHRPVASRLVFARRERRCLWCGGRVREPAPVRLRGVPELRACAAEAAALARFLRFCDRAAPVLRLGILVPVLGYFLLGGLAAAGVELLSLPARKGLFRGVIAASVVSVALLHRKAQPRPPVAFPFPVHNLALLGVRWTLLVFLGVGLWWLWLSVRQLLAWLGT